MKAFYTFSNQKVFVNLLALYFIFLVFGAMNIGSIGSLLRIFAFLPVFWWLINKHAITLSRPLLASILFFTFSSLSVFWSIDINKTLVKITGPISLVFLLCATSGYHYNKENIFFLKKALVWSSRLTAVVVLFFGSTLESRLTFGGVLIEDPNYLCSYYLFGVAFAVENILNNHKISNKIKYLIELLVYLILVFATGSRGGLLSILTAIFVVICCNFFFYRFSLRKIFLPLILIFMSIVLICLLPYILPKEVLERFYFQAIIDSHGTGRYQLWQDYINIFMDSDAFRQLVGYGLRTSPILAIYHHLVYLNVAHNIFVEYLIGVGVIGVLLYIFMLWQFIRYTYNYKNIFAFSVLIGLIVLTFSTSFFGKVYWNILIYIICLNKLFVTNMVKVK